MQLAPGQRKQPKQLRSRLMVETILEAAAQVFSERGFEAATTNQIAERAGISIGSLYQYFPNKDSLILAVQKVHHDQVLSVIRAAMERSRNLPLRDAIKTIVGANLDLHLADAKLHAAFEEWIPTQSRLVDRDEFQKDMIATVSGYLESRPDVPESSDRGAAIFVIMNLVKSVMHASVSVERPIEDREQILNRVADGVVGCLQPVSGSPASSC